MSLSLHDMISRAISEAESATLTAEYTEKVASDSTVQTESSDLDPLHVDKLASAVEYIVENLPSIVDDRSDEEKLAELHEKLALDSANEPASTAPEVNAEGTGGEQAEVKDKASTVDIPKDPPTEAVRPGEANTALKTDAHTKKAAAAQAILEHLKEGGVKEKAVQTAEESVLRGGARKAVGKAKDWVKKPFEEYSAGVAKRTAQGKGAAELGERYGAVSPKGMRADVIKDVIKGSKGQAAAAAATGVTTATAASIAAKKALSKKDEDDSEKEATGAAVLGGLKAFGSGAAKGVKGVAKSLSKAPGHLAAGRYAQAGKVIAPTALAAGAGIGLGRLSKGKEVTASADEVSSLIEAINPGTEVPDMDPKMASLRQFMLQKVADDALGDVSLAAGSSDSTYHASASGEDVPMKPEGEKGIESNEAAINLTKRDAKAGPKSDLREVLGEPAQSSASDGQIAANLQNASASGVKISSDEAASIREAMLKVAEDGCSCRQQGSCPTCSLDEIVSSLEVGWDVDGSPVSEDTV